VQSHHFFLQILEASVVEKYMVSVMKRPEFEDVLKIVFFSGVKSPPYYEFKFPSKL
jgi:hypothetical protein